MKKISPESREGIATTGSTTGNVTGKKLTAFYLLKQENIRNGVDTHPEGTPPLPKIKSRQELFEKKQGRLNASPGPEASFLSPEF